MEKIAAVAVVLATALLSCTATRMAIAPSARHRTEDILAAAKYLNDYVGMEAFIVVSADSEDLIRGSAIIRKFEPRNNGKVIGNCKKLARGVIISISDKCDVFCVAHELGHAVGLEHHSDKNNLMYPFTPNGAELDDEQTRRVRAVAMSHGR